MCECLKKCFETTSPKYREFQNNNRRKFRKIESVSDCECLKTSTKYEKIIKFPEVKKLLYRYVY